MNNGLVLKRARRSIWTHLTSKSHLKSLACISARDYKVFGKYLCSNRYGMQSRIVCLAGCVDIKSIQLKVSGIGWYDSIFKGLGLKVDLIVC